MKPDCTRPPAAALPPTRRRLLRGALAATGAAAARALSPVLSPALGAALLAGAGLGGCAGLGGPRVITFSETELALMLARRFPVRRRVLELLELEASEPALRLLPERNRLDLRVRLTLRERVSGLQQAGAIAFDTALRWDAGARSVRLTQVQLHDDDHGGVAARIGRVALERLLEDLPIWQLDEARERQLRDWGLQPTAVTVTARGVEVTLARNPG